MGRKRVPYLLQRVVKYGPLGCIGKKGAHKGPLDKGQGGTMDILSLQLLMNPVPPGRWLAYVPGIGCHGRTLPRNFRKPGYRDCKIRP